MKKFGVNLNNISCHVKKAQYAVRGPIVARSQELAKEGRPIISCNIGNPQALNQKPISFLRDVISICINPRLIDQIKFPKDVVERAQRYLTSTPSLGAYTESQGIFSVRQDISNFLKERDGFPAAPSDIFLTNGASDGVRLTMQAIFKDVGTLFKEGSNLSKEGLLTPIPQYPLYSALSTLMQIELVPYYLNEAKDWTVTSADLDKSLATARANGINTRAMVVINPGNPTGQCLSLQDMQVIVLWCHQNEILLLADEVYQENVYKEGAKFISFRKVAKDLGAFSGRNSLQMISYHSTSKGFLGECGLRGGYFELLGFSVEIKNEILKLCSISLCSNTIGQIATGLMVRPPVEGDESYDLYVKERDSIKSSLLRRAKRMSIALNTMPGITCNSIEGAMYAFPAIQIPAKAIAAAKKKKMAPDALYSLELLEATGIVVVPGSGFGQAPGTWHFRTTILPEEDKIEQVIVLLEKFQEDFLIRYGK